jgi:hypothetical protein
MQTQTATMPHVANHLETTDNIFKKMTKEQLEKELKTQNDFLTQAQQEQNQPAVQGIEEDINQIKVALKEKL